MIFYNEQSKTFLLHSGEMTTALQIDEEGRLYCLWYGPKLTREEDLPCIDELTKWYLQDTPYTEQFGEYPGWSSGMGGNESACKAVFDNGSRNLLLRYHSHGIEGEKLKIVLKDVDFNLYVYIEYKICDESSSLERTITLENQTNGTVVFEQFYSGVLHLPHRENWRFTSLTGKWGGEYRITHAPLRDGQMVLETKSIFSGATAVPFAAFDQGDANEKSGGVWFANLVWSGTHRVIAERDSHGNVSAFLGINPFDCRITLKEHERYTLPTLTCGYTEDGFGGMSRAIIRYEQAHIMHSEEVERILPVIYNAYGAFYSDVNEEKIMSVIKTAKELGIEALIIDAGWAGIGDNYQLGMGTWNQNKERFPRGLKAISDEVHRNGMLFGLWMEPEVVHKDNPLVLEHPDWVFEFPYRGPDIKGNFRMVLNLALDEVREYMTAQITRLIDTCGVDYFKIDFNRFLWEADSLAVDENARRSLWVKYVDNLCGMYMEIKNRYPKLLFENCAAGGHRTDLSMLRFSGRINRSDNQDPIDILTMHEGFSYIMPSKMAGGGCHISDVFTYHMDYRVSPMRFQAHVAMMGSLAVGKNLVTMTPEETEELKELIALHKSVRKIVQHGELYRLVSAIDHNYAAFEYLSKDKTEAVLFVYGKSTSLLRIPENILLDGLDEDAIYDVEGFGLRSGKGLMRVGIRCVLKGDMDSKVVRIRKI